MKRSSRVSVATSVIIVAVGAFSSVGCSSVGNRWPASTPSVVEGQVDSSSFPSKVTAFEATDENGNVFTGAVDTSGAFSLSLPSAHQYSLSVEMQEGSALVVFPRSNRVDQAFALESDDATVLLGTIRLLTSESVVLGASADCPDGTTATGGQVCTVPASQVSCVGGYVSTPASCDDVSVVLGYGSLASAASQAPAGTRFAVPAVAPPCEVVGCDAPSPANPPQGTVAD